MGPESPPAQAVPAREKGKETHHSQLAMMSTFKSHGSLHLAGCQRGNVGANDDHRKLASDELWTFCEPRNARGGEAKHGQSQKMLAD